MCFNKFLYEIPGVLSGLLSLLNVLFFPFPPKISFFTFQSFRHKAAELLLRTKEQRLFPLRSLASEVWPQKFGLRNLASEIWLQTKTASSETKPIENWLGNVRPYSDVALRIMNVV